MQDFKTFKNLDARYQVDVLLAQLEKICQETSHTKAYAAAKLLGILHTMKDFQHIIADFHSQLIKQEHFDLAEKPQVIREQIEKTCQSHEILKQYQQRRRVLPG